LSFISQMVKQISFPPPIFSLHLKQADMIWSKTKRHCNNLFSKNGCSCYWYYTWIEKWTTLYYKPHIFFTIHMQDYCSVEEMPCQLNIFIDTIWPIFLLIYVNDQYSFSAFWLLHALELMHCFANSCLLIHFSIPLSLVYSSVPIHFIFASCVRCVLQTDVVFHRQV